MNHHVQLNVVDATTLAQEYMMAGGFSEAEAIWRAVLQTDNGNASAAHSLAICLLEQRKCAESLDILDRLAVMHRDELIFIACNRGRALADMGRADEAMATLQGVLKSYPDHMTSRYNRGLVLLQMGRCEEAISDFDAVLKAEPGNDKARFGRGFANLVLGRYAPGFVDYECRLKDNIQEPDAPLWTGMPLLDGSTVLVHGEQGLGDNIMFARYLPLLVSRGVKVLVWVPDVVSPLFRHLDGVTTLEDDRGKWPKFDYWVRFMSLAYCFGTLATTVPPPVSLRFSPEKINKWKRIIKDDGRRKIGLCWSGSRQSRYDEHRSIALAKLKPLFDLNASFYSLQLDVRDEDRDAFASLPIVSLERELSTFDDTAHAMACLDHVVTVDTSVAHLAGTVGVPTSLMLTAFRTYWLWIEKRDTSPWYPSLRLFRQQRDGEWDDVVARIKAALF